MQQVKWPVSGRMAGLGENGGMDRYTVILTGEEIEQLQSLVTKGQHAAQKVINALILLNCDESCG